MKYTIHAAYGGKKFSKTVEAPTEKQAIERMYSLAGAEHGFLRRKIDVQKIETTGKN